MTEIGLELDVLDVVEISDEKFQFKTLPKSLAETKNILERDFKSSVTLVSTELTYASPNPVELDEEDYDHVENFEEKIHQIIAKPDLHFELGNIYYNFEF